MHNYDCYIERSISDDSYIYGIIFNKSMSVTDFIYQWVSGKKESDNENSRFGRISVNDGSDNPYVCHYKYGKITNSKIPTDIASKTIIRASAHGGWGRMDIDLYV